MLILLSPAKKLHAAGAAPLWPTLTRPLFQDQADLLAGRLRALQAPGLARLMDLSPALAAQNAARFARFGSDANRAAAQPALHAFAGDVYVGLDAASLGAADLTFAQRHLRILSGLYGLLAPADAIEPYRLEMGSRLSNPAGPTLYDLWRPLLAPVLADLLREEGRAPVLVNLASDEYAKAVAWEALRAALPQVEVLTPTFREVRADGSTGSFFAMVKRARGQMARGLIQARARTAQDVAAWSGEGFALAEARPDGTLLFTRPARPAAGAKGRGKAA